jgi:hypothetical protein
MKKFLLLATLFLILLGMSLTVYAVDLCDYSGATNYGDEDLGLPAGQEISSMDYVLDGTSHCFRINLEGAIQPGSFADEYGVFITTDLNTVSNFGNPYAPPGLQGNTLFDGHQLGGLSFSAQHDHEYTGIGSLAGFDVRALGSGEFDFNMATGVLQFKFSQSDIGSDFSATAASYDLGIQTFDILSITVGDGPTPLSGGLPEFSSMTAIIGIFVGVGIAFVAMKMKE